MARGVIQFSITDAAGNVVPEASVEVRNSDTLSLVGLWEQRSGGDALGNPAQADEDGYFRAYCNPQRVNITATLGEFERTWMDVVVIEDRASIVLTGPLTVNIPSDYSNLQSAIDDLSSLSPTSGAVINLRIEEGHQPTSGIVVSDGDYRHFRITSEDPLVTVSSEFTGLFVLGSRCHLPSLYCLVDMDGRGDGGYTAEQASTGYVRIGCGIINSGGNGISAQSNSIIRAQQAICTGAAHHAFNAVQGSNIDARLAVADGAGRAGFACTGNSTMCARDSSAQNCAADSSFTPNAAYIVDRVSYLDARGCIGTGSGEYGLTCDNGSVANVRDGDFSGAASTGIQAVRSSRVHALDSICDGVGANGYSAFATSVINAQGGQCDGAGLVGAVAADGSQINLRFAVITDAGTYGISSEHGSIVNAREATVTGSSTADLRVVGGASITAISCTTTDGAGSPDEADTNVGAFNALSSNLGIIWA